MITIRPLNEQDLPALLSLYGELHPGEAGRSADEDARRQWGRLVAHEGTVCLGLFRANLLVASCVLHVLPNLTRGGRPYALLENVVTASAHRRLGFGRQLLIAAKEAAWRQGCYKVMLLTGRLDEGTAAFYRTAGFLDNEKKGFIARP